MEIVADFIVPVTWTRAMLHELVARDLVGRKLIVVTHSEPGLRSSPGVQPEGLRPASGAIAALQPIVAAAGGTWIFSGRKGADDAAAEPAQPATAAPEAPSFTQRRIWLTEEEEAGFARGLSDEGLWPLCQMSLPRPVFRQSDWDAYKEANRRFAEAVKAEAGDGPAAVIIHGCHFGLLPGMLKAWAAERLLVGQFWNIAWPAREVFQAFPWTQELRQGLLGNDLLGFQAAHHCRNFLEMAGRAPQPAGAREAAKIELSTNVKAFPLRVESGAQAVETEVEGAMQDWRVQLQLEQRVLGIGLARLHGAQEILGRLRGLDAFFEAHPEWRGRLVFAEVAVAERFHLEGLGNIGRDLQALAAEINARWRTADWQPIVLLGEHQDSAAKAALHRMASFCIASAPDGAMNFETKEFLSNRADGLGVLILGRANGPRAESAGALEIDPFIPREVSDAVALALTMPPAEQRRRLELLREEISHPDVFRWAGNFLSELLKNKTIDHGEEPTLDASLGRISHPDCQAP